MSKRVESKKKYKARNQWLKDIVVEADLKIFVPVESETAADEETPKEAADAAVGETAEEATEPTSDSSE